MSATSRSFQTHRNWKMTSEAMAGTESGITIRKLHPRERISGERGDRDGDDRGRDRNHEAVEEARTEIALRQHRGVVVERELVRRRERRPPPAGGDGGERSEGAHQEADGGHHPGHREADDRDVQRNPGKPFGEPQWRVPDGGGFPPCCRDAHRLASTARNCRRLKTSTGITATNRMIATALAAP